MSDPLFFEDLPEEEAAREIGRHRRIAASMIVRLRLPEGRIRRRCRAPGGYNDDLLYALLKRTDRLFPDKAAAAVRAVFGGDEGAAEL